MSRGWVVIRAHEGRLQFLGEHDWVGELTDECLIEDERTASRLVREPGESRVSWEMATSWAEDQRGAP